MTLPIIEAALATQEPMEPDALAREGAWSIAPLDLSGYEFALRCAGESQAAIAAWEAAAKAAHDAIDARLADLKAKEEPRIAFFMGRVAEAAERDKDTLLLGKKRSREFLAGKVAWRRKPAKVVIDDRAALVDYLTKNGDPDLVRVKVEPDLKAIQDRFAKDGVLLPGTSFESERDELSVEPLPTPTLPPMRNP
jgi:phage host-nuclease inhibitor protein Gam